MCCDCISFPRVIEVMSDACSTGGASSPVGKVRSLPVTVAVTTASVSSEAAGVAGADSGCGPQPVNTSSAVKAVSRTTFMMCARDDRIRERSSAFPHASTPARGAYFFFAGGTAVGAEGFFWLEDFLALCCAFFF